MARGDRLRAQYHAQLFDGHLHLRWLLHRHQARSGSGKLALDIARIMSGNKQPSKTMLNRAQAAVQRVSAGMGYVVPIVTAAGALVTGLRKLFE